MAMCLREAMRAERPGVLTIYSHMYQVKVVTNINQAHLPLLVDAPHTSD